MMTESLECFHISLQVQERLSTLDAGDDYVMTVTTISGPRQTSEEVPIHNKFYTEQEQVKFQ